MFCVRLATRHIARRTFTAARLATQTSLCTSAPPPTTIPSPAPSTATDAVATQDADYFRQLITVASPEAVGPAVPPTPLGDVRPALPGRSRTLAPYVGESETLQQLVKLGVSLWRIERKHKEVATRLAVADFERDVQPALLWLRDRGVSADELGAVVTAHPALLDTPVDLLQNRVDYLTSKKFDEASIARIIAKAPAFLSESTKNIDRQLGYLQRSFHLTGDELRLTVTRLPKLFVWNRHFIERIRETIEKFFGFTKAEQKKLLIAMPKIYLSNNRTLSRVFDFVHNEMSISHELITDWPSVLRTRLFVVKQRHLFLRHLGRAQYDPTRPNYVSLEALVSCRDPEFCENVAKTSVREFNDFLKTI